MESPTGPAAAEQPAELVGVAALLEAAAAAAGAPLAWAAGGKRKVQLDGDERGGGDWKAARRDPDASALASSAAVAGAAAGFASAAATARAAAASAEARAAMCARSEERRVGKECRL